MYRYTDHNQNAKRYYILNILGLVVLTAALFGCGHILIQETNTNRQEAYATRQEVQEDRKRKGEQKARTPLKSNTVVSYQTVEMTL